MDAESHFTAYRRNVLLLHTSRYVTACDSVLPVLPRVSTASDNTGVRRPGYEAIVPARICISSELCRGHGNPFNCQCLHNSSCSIKYYNQLLSLVPLTSAVSPRLHPLQLLLPDCIHFSCCSLIASASAAAPRLRPLQLSFPDCDFSSSF